MTQNKRHIHYINPSIQNRLIISFITFEVILVAIALFVFYLDINGIVEDNLYRIHVSTTSNVELFLISLLKVICVLLIVNLIVASIIVWLWRRYINSIVEPLEMLVETIDQLDFSQQIEVSQKHDVLINMNHWYAQEKENHEKIRKLLAKIKDTPDPTSDEQNIEYLREIDSLLTQ